MVTMNKGEYGCLLLLFTINLLNYMDRYTIAGVLTEIQQFFKIDDGQSGFLQTIFIVFYMVFAPICGFVGDRYNRKWIIVVGITMWVAAVLASSFVPPKQFYVFLLLRGVVGIGEASYSTIAPTIIADIFTVSQRSRALMFFYFAIPFGSGLGYITASNISHLFGGWQWGVRLSPIIGLICVVLLMIFFEEPKRGDAEKDQCSGSSEIELEQTNYLEDIKAICKIPTYVTSTIAYTSVVFVTGTLAWWTPTAIEQSFAMRLNLSSANDLKADQKNSISFHFGLVTVAGGVFGVTLGTVLAQMWENGTWCFRPIRTVRAKALICAIGSLLATPAFFISLHLAAVNINIAWIFFFFTILTLCLNWAINMDMMLDIIVPNRRSVANSWQILISHLFGDATGPYIIGMISDSLRGSSNSPSIKFHALVDAFYLANVILLLSALFFFASAVFYVRDHERFERQMNKSRSTTSSAIYDGRQVTIKNIEGIANDAFR